MAHEHEMRRQTDHQLQVACLRPGQVSMPSQFITTSRMHQGGQSTAHHYGFQTLARDNAATRPSTLPISTVSDHLFAKAIHPPVASHVSQMPTTTPSAGQPPSFPMNTTLPIAPPAPYTHAYPSAVGSFASSFMADTATAYPSFTEQSSTSQPAYFPVWMPAASMEPTLAAHYSAAPNLMGSTTDTPVGPSTLYLTGPTMASHPYFNVSASQMPTMTAAPSTNAILGTSIHARPSVSSQMIATPPNQLQIAAQYSRIPIITSTLAGQPPSPVMESTTPPTYSQFAVPVSQVNFHNASTRSFTSPPTGAPIPVYPTFRQASLMPMTNVPMEPPASFVPNPRTIIQSNETPLPLQEYTHNAYMTPSEPAYMNAITSMRGPTVPTAVAPMDPSEPLNGGTVAAYPLHVRSTLMDPTKNFPKETPVLHSTRATIAPRDQTTKQTLQTSRTAARLPIRSSTAASRRFRLEYRSRAPIEDTNRPQSPTLFYPPRLSKPTIHPQGRMTPYPTTAQRQVSENLSESAPFHLDSGVPSVLSPQHHATALSPFCRMATEKTSIPSVTQSAGSSAGSHTRLQSQATASSSSSIDPVHSPSVIKRQLQLLHKILLSQKWVHFNEPEPPILDTEMLPYTTSNRNRISSRFDFFYEKDGSHRCIWDEDGKPCRYTTVRKDLAQDHARRHFNYMPFICFGNCGDSTCTKKYGCSSRLKEHLKRGKEPRKLCDVCGRPYDSQNLARHEKHCKFSVIPFAQSD